METDNELIKDLKAGNDAAFDNIFRSYYGLLVYVASGITTDKGVAEEIVQDVFMTLWQQRTTLDITTSLKAYLTTICRNRCIDYLRSPATRFRKSLLSADDAVVRAQLLEMHSDMNPPEELFASPTEIALRRAIAELPPQCRRIFKLNRFEGYSCSAIAKMLNLSVSTVKTQVARAVQKLKEVVEK